MKIKSSVCVLFAVMFLATASFAGGAAPEPVPPCPWPVQIEKPAPGTPEKFSELLGEWEGFCEARGRGILYQVKAIILSVSSNQAHLFFGRGKAVPSQVLIRAQDSGWYNIKADLAIENGVICIKWHGAKSGYSQVFRLKEDRLVSLTSNPSDSFETILSKK